MKKIGLTGSIGSGKSTVSKIFSCLGINIYYADLEARKLLSSEKLKTTLYNRYGSAIISVDNEIDRRKLGALVFQKKEELDFLNSILHPVVKANFESWVQQFPDDAYTLHEAAILFESGFHDQFDAIICLSAPKEMRVERVITRDGLSRSEVLERMDNQWSDEKKIALSDYIIYNDEEHPVIPQILNIHRQIINND